MVNKIKTNYNMYNMTNFLNKQFYTKNNNTGSSKRKFNFKVVTKIQRRYLFKKIICY